MPIVVEVLSAEKYAAWVGEQKKKIAAAADDPNKKWNLADLKARGEKVYAANCVTCHQANGQGSRERSRRLTAPSSRTVPGDATSRSC